MVEITSILSHRFLELLLMFTVVMTLEGTTPSPHEVLHVGMIRPVIGNTQTKFSGVLTSRPCACSWFRLRIALSCPL